MNNVKYKSEAQRKASEIYDLLSNFKNDIYLEYYDESSGAFIFYLDGYKCRITPDEDDVYSIKIIKTHNIEQKTLLNETYGIKGIELCSRFRDIMDNLPNY